jgi:hypothetical protein
MLAFRPLEFGDAAMRGRLGRGGVKEFFHFVEAGGREMAMRHRASPTSDR